MRIMRPEAIPLQGSHWDSLPYGKIYSELTNAPKNDNGRDDRVGQIKGAIGTEKYVDERVGAILNAYSYASAKERENSPNNDYCNVLYYWIGDALINDFGVKSTFSDYMHKIYDALKSGSMEDGCCIIYTDNINKDTFKEREKVYTYHLNYGDLEKQLREEDGNRRSCDADYCTYLSDTVTAYHNMWENCNNKDQHTTYCKKFKTKYEKNKEGGEKIEFTCNKVSTSCLASMTDSRMSSSEGLPSEKIYNKLNMAPYSCTEAHADTRRREILEMLTDDEDKVDPILGAYSYAPKMTISNLSNKDDRCKFFYFWLGDMLPDTMKNSSFHSFMNKIFSALYMGNVEGMCPLKYNKEISWSLFKNGKVVFDYYHDYDAIKGKVEDSNTPDRVEYCQRVQRAAEAFKNVQDNCGASSIYEYCLEFNSTYINHDPQELLDSTCKSILAQQEAKIQQQQHAKDKSVATAVSGSLVTAIGLPTIVFLLYKVQLQLLSQLGKY